MLGAYAIELLDSCIIMHGFYTLSTIGSVGAVHTIWNQLL